jgi:hypothetical protein
MSGGCVDLAERQMLLDELKLEVIDRDEYRRLVHPTLDADGWRRMADRLTVENSELRVRVYTAEAASKANVGG